MASWSLGLLSGHSQSDSGDAPARHMVTSTEESLLQPGGVELRKYVDERRKARVRTSEEREEVGSWEAS